MATFTVPVNGHIRTCPHDVKARTGVRRWLKLGVIAAVWAGGRLLEVVKVSNIGWHLFVFVVFDFVCIRT